MNIFNYNFFVSLLNILILFMGFAYLGDDMAQLICERHNKSRRSGIMRIFCIILPLIGLFLLMFNHIIDFGWYMRLFVMSLSLVGFPLGYYANIKGW